MAVDEFCPAPLKCPCCSFAIQEMWLKRKQMYVLERFQTVLKVHESIFCTSLFTAFGLVCDCQHLLLSQVSADGPWYSFTITSFSWWALVFFYYRKFQLMGPGILLRSKESAEGPGILFGTPTLCEPANSYTVFMNKSKKAILHLSNLTILHFSNLKGDSVWHFLQFDWCLGNFTF